jgi:PAS domain S-box-containing protein
MSVDDAVVIVNAMGRILMTNARVDALLGYQPNELVGRRSLEMVAPDARDATAAMVKRQVETGLDQTYVAPLLKADDTTLLVTIASANVATEDGKRFRILTIRPRGLRTEKAARIRLIGMRDARVGLEERWPAVAARAATAAEAVIQRWCGEEDSYCQVDDTTYLLCFGSLDEQQASFRAATIGQEIRDRLIAQGGDPETSNVQAIAAGVRFAERPGLAANMHLTLLGALEAQMPRLAHEARQTLATVAATASCDLKRVAGRGVGETLAWQTDLPSRIKQRVYAALSVLPPEEARLFDLDGLVLGAAARRAVEAAADGDQVPYLVRIRFDVFASRQLTERFLRVCANVDRQIVNRLILLLAALPPGVPRSRQMECIIRFRPFCRAVGFEVDDLDELAEIELSYNPDPIVSIPASILTSGDAERLQSAIGLLHTRRTRVLIREVGSADDAASFRALGADMISM